MELRNSLMRTHFGRRVYGTVIAPAGAPAATETWAGKARERAYLVNGFGFAVHHKSYCIATIVGLISTCRPTHIARFVMTIIVDAFKGVSSRRPWTKFFQKVLERGKSKLNASAPIPFKISAGRCLTAGLSATIARMLKRRNPVNRSTVARSCHANKFTCFTATGFYRIFLRHKVRTSNNLCIAADAQAQPEGAAVRVETGELQHEQIAKLQFQQILDSGASKIFGDWFSIGSSHFDLSFRLNWLGSQFRVIGAVGHLYCNKTGVCAPC